MKTWRPCPPPRRNPGPESTTIFISIQFGVFGVVATYLIYFAAAQHQRNQRSWQAIIDRLSPESRKLAALHNGNVIPANTHGFGAFRDTGVMMEIADYIERNAREFDKAFLSEFRNIAIRIRCTALLPVSRR